MSEERSVGDLKRTPVIFFVDDDPGVRKSFRLLLERRGFEVMEAASAEEATHLSESFKEHIDVLLMDINLPDGWGATLAQGLLEQHPEMVVVYTTGFAEEDPILSGALNDAPFVLRKPFTPEELLDVMWKAIPEEPLG